MHYGRPRLFAPGDRDTVLLLGDYLYAQGSSGSPRRLGRGCRGHGRADLALCPAPRRERAGDGAAWAASVALLGHGVLKETEDGAELLVRAREAAGDEAVERSLEAHARRVG